MFGSTEVVGNEVVGEYYGTLESLTAYIGPWPLNHKVERNFNITSRELIALIPSDELLKLENMRLVDADTNKAWLLVMADRTVDLKSPLTVHLLNLVVAGGKSLTQPTVDNILLGLTVS